MIKAQTLKGFRDFLPQEAKKRQFVLDALKKVFESYGFEPLETPSLEYQEILLGKYGDEGDKLMYRFEDNGKRKVALRYDQTVPLARVVAQYQNELPMPFKRYQIQNVWRAENTQKGRYREFLQCDIDTVGTASPLADAEIIKIAATSLKALGFKKFKILLNDRNILFGTTVSKVISQEKIIRTVIALDKFKKIGKDGVIKEIEKIGYTNQEANEIFSKTTYAKETSLLKEIIGNMEKLGITKDEYEFFSVLARGLSYYTSTIFEIEIEGYSAGSVCGGGRYDNLIGLFANKQIPAVGFAFGFDRLMEAMEELKLFPADLVTTKVLVTIFPGLKEKSLEITTLLREKGINTEVYLDENAKMDKQLKYADKKQIPYVVIIGPDEASKNMITLKNMKTRDQEVISEKELIGKLFP